MINNYDQEIEDDDTSAHCTECGKKIKGDEDSLCGACAGEEPEFSEEEIEEAEGHNHYGIRS